ncbi:hypothetical protein KY289_016818 [Solanum tuberosum]|nr:hypothetical protein KY289_016818 [Solanum tuberosum]
MRRPTGVVISDEPSRVNISKRASAHQSHNASTHVAPQSGYTISTPTVVPSSGCQTLQGYSHLGRGSTIPSASASQCNSLNTSSGSIGLSNLHLESNGSEPNTPTTQNSNAHGPQLGDRDNFRRPVIEPLGYNASELTRMVCIQIGVRFHLTPKGRCSTNLRSEIGKMAHASEKGGSLYTDGAISQGTRKERMEKELGRPVAVAEMFKSVGEPIRGLVYGYPEKVYQKKKSWYCGSSSSSFDGEDRETISAMESKIAYLNAELATVAEREKKRKEKEKKKRGRERRRLRQQRK